MRQRVSTYAHTATCIIQTAYIETSLIHGDFVNRVIAKFVPFNEHDECKITMLEAITILSLVGGLTTLYFLSSIDLKSGILPNELVLGFCALGMVFHLGTVFTYLTMNEMILGCFIGGAILYAIRTAANMFYEEDALGLGDVKLLAAAGVWLGPYHILIALTLGALAGIIHGLFFVIYYRVKSQAFIPLGTLSLPAGPGFAVGIILTAAYVFRDFPQTVFNLF